MDCVLSEDNFIPEGEDYNMLLDNLKSYLPFLKRVIDRQDLGIQEEHLNKLQNLYEMIDSKRLSANKLKPCQKVINSLYSKYNEMITKDGDNNMNDSKEVYQSYEEEDKTKSSEVRMTKNKSDQNLNCEFELSSKISVSSTRDNPFNSVEHLMKDKVPKVPVIEKCHENSDNKELTSINQNDLPEFSDSRLRLNKVIGFASNASIGKINNSGTIIAESELAKQIFDEITKQNNQNILCTQMLKGINMNDIEMNHVKKVIENIIKPSVDPIELPPPPPADLMELQKASVKFIISSEHNDHKTNDNIISVLPEPQPSFSSIPFKSISIREKLNSEINILHKIGSSNEPKSKFISSLKPGTLIDLENSKLTRSSLHIESLRPVIKSIDNKVPNAPDKIVSRDPRIKKNKNLLNSESIYSFQTNKQLFIPTSIIPNTQTQSSSTVSSSVLLSNMNHSTSKLQEMSQEILGCHESNFVNSSSQTNLQTFNKPTEHKGNPNKPQFINSRTSTHNQYKQNDFTYDKNNSSQMQVNSTYHNDTMVRCCDPASNSDTTLMRNQRLKHEQNKQFRSFKEFRQAKYGKVKSSKQESTKNKTHDCHQSFRDDDIFKQIFHPKSKKFDSNLRSVNDSSIIKSFKIPKIKRKEELVNIVKDNHSDINLTTSEIIEKSMKADPIKDNSTEENMKIDVVIKKSNLKNIKTTKDNIIQDMKTCTIKDNNTSNDLKSDTVKDNITKQNTTFEINIDNDEKNDLKTDANKDDFIETDKDQDLNLEIFSESSSMNNEQSFKVKKLKKYSNEKEFEKIVKEAVESLNDGYYPRIRTRSSLKNNEESLIKLNVKKAKQVDINCEQLVLKESKNLDKQSGECSKNLGSESVHISGFDTSGSIETEQNIISSTSKEPVETDYSINCNISNENIVSSSEIHSTVDNMNPKINEKVLSNILAHPELMDILQDKGKLTKLTKLIKTSDINTNEENNFNKEHGHSNIDELKKINYSNRKNYKNRKNKIRKRKKLQKKNRNKNDDSLNTEVNMADSSFKDSNDNGSKDSDCSSIDQVKKKKKRKKSKEKYAHFEIQDKHDSCKDLKIVISKFDKNIKKSEHLNLKVSSDDLQTCHQPTNDKKNHSIKRKKPFLGPLSVKLARQKMESKLNNSENELVENTQYKIKTTNIISKINSQSIANTLIEPYVVLNPYECTSKYPTSFKGSNDTTFQSKLPVAEQNSISTTSIEPNITFVKSKKPRSKMTELDKLHADINENCAAVLTVSNVRHCRQNKSVDYINAIVSPKKKKTTSIDFNNDDNYLETLKKKKIKKNKKIKNKLSHTSVTNTTISDKAPNILHPDNLNKIKFKKSKKKKYKQWDFNKKSSDNNSLNDEVSTEVTSKIVTDKEFIDKFYLHNADNLFDCKCCQYIDTGLNIVRHYKEKHKDEEVFPSKLSKNCAEVLISESLKENFGFISTEQFEDSKFIRSMPENICFTCIFCRKLFCDFIKFYDHITSHTGEYRYKCKICEQVYSNEDELEKHILEHSDYDKTDGISYLLLHNPIQNTRMFGYLCSFCYFIQIDYNNVVKHMILRHRDEDKQCNGNWSIIRVSLSVENENTTTSEIDYKNLVGCLPPVLLNQQIQNTKFIDEDPEDQKSHISVSELIVKVKKKLQVDSASIKKELQDLPESSIQSSPEQIDLSYESKHIFSGVDPVILNSEYTLKEKSTKCMVAGLSCEIMNSELLYKCSVCKCQQNEFSTVVLADFFKHIELNHQYLNWNRMCDLCSHKLPKNVDQYYLKDALEHLISYHMVLKKDEKPTLDLNDQLPSPIDHQGSIENSTTIEKPKPLMSLRVRCLPGDKLSLRDETMTKEEEERNLNEDLHKFVLKDDCKDGIVGSIKCEQVNNKLLFKCLDKLCLNELSTLSYEELLKHIELYHKITSWDGMCNICGYGLWRKWNHLYMKNALEHLISYHLIECQITNIIEPSKTDTSISKDGLPVSNMLESTISDTQTGVTVFKNLSEEISLDISEQPNQIVINNPLEASAEQAHIDQICDKKLPLLYPIDIDREEEVNCSEINPSESINGNLCTPMKMKVVCKNIPPDPIIYLEPGQQIVNNGEPIQGTYCLIDTGYKKSYLKTLKNLSFNVMKTQQAFSYMTELPRLLGLYKCFDRTCTKIFSDKMLFILHMKLHYSNMERKKKNQIYNTEQFKKCIYCFKSFDDAESLANHIAEKYTYCKYFCSFCFYCAYEASHVFIHQSIVHDKAIPSILHLEYEEGFIENSKEILMAVDYNEFILPYRCNVGGCLFECYLHDDFLKHLNQKHQQCDKFCCYICASQDEGEGFFALQPKLMISHFKLHSINLYQCIFCLCGNDSIDSMLKHLAMEHFEYKPLCLERSPISDTCDASKIENLKIIKINKTIENCWVKKVTLSPGTSFSPEVLKKRTRKKRRLESSDVLSVAMKSASIDENAQPSDAIIITVPDRAQMTEGTSITLHNDNEFIILDDVNQNDMQDPLKRVTVCSGTKNNEKDMLPHNDDVIIIDDDDDSDNDTSKKEQNKVPTKRKRSTDKSVDQSDKIKILFSCKKCDKHFTNSPDYQIHLNSCPFWRGTESMDHQCIFCSKIFPSELRLTQHIKLHGPIRFRCSVCNFKMPSRAVSTHMKNKHNLLKLDYFPEDPKFQNLDKDPFFVKERKKLAPKEHTDNQCVDSFYCGECSYKGNTQNIVVLHMKNVHNIDEYDITPVKKSVSSREYLIQRNKSINVLMPQLQSSSAKRKRKNGSHKKGSSKAKDNINSDKKKSLLFNPNTIDDIPKSHIFTEPIGCSLCTYNTKVRSNLIIHLNGHTIGQDNITKEIVNPVPSMGKSELMFDKMINLSASSFDAMNTLKMKTDEINKKIIEVDSQDDLNIDSYPQFVPKNKRYKCSAPCNYTCITEHMLMSHISILHSNFQWYICPHCPKNSTQAKVELNQIEFHLMHHSENLYRCQYCVYIDFNRDEMRAHMRKSHLPEVTSTDQSNIIVIRKTELEDIIIDRIKHQAQSIASQWICNICSNGIKYTELEITSHIFQVHKVSHMFKCPMCQFENSDDNAKVFEKHYKLNHPSVAVKCLRVFEEVTDDEKLDKQPVIAANMLEQQALESIEPSLVPHTCRGIPIESIPTNKASNKSMPKSPKKTVKSFQSPVNKQKTLIDNFKKDDSLGYISSNGQFACPRCNEFETLNVDLFREHLYKDVNYRTWKCMNCFEISDSPKKMAWHIKKHGISSKYEKFEDNEKFKWVERVIEHQYNLFDESKKNKIQCAKGPEQSKTVVADKKTLNSPSKKRNIESVKKILIPQITDDNIINLLDDSDDE